MTIIAATLMVLLAFELLVVCWRVDRLREDVAALQSERDRELREPELVRQLNRGRFVGRWPR